RPERHKRPALKLARARRLLALLRPRARRHAVQSREECPQRVRVGRSQLDAGASEVVREFLDGPVERAVRDDLLGIAAAGEDDRRAGALAEPPQERGLADT